jgi:hypothetical protein
MKDTNQNSVRHEEKCFFVENDPCTSLVLEKCVGAGKKEQTCRMCLSSSVTTGSGGRRDASNDRIIFFF